MKKEAGRACRATISDMKHYEIVAWQVLAAIIFAAKQSRMFPRASFNWKGKRRKMA
jgi:hypothetical protein